MDAKNLPKNGFIDPNIDYSSFVYDKVDLCETNNNKYIRSIEGWFKFSNNANNLLLCSWIISLEIIHEQF